MKHASSLPEWQKNVVEFLSSRRKYRLFGWEFGPILLDELYRIRDYRTDYIRVGTFFTPIVAFSAGLLSFESTRRVNLAAVVTSSLIVLGIITTLAVDYQMTKRKAGVVKERNYKTIQVANYSMEVENGNRSRRSIDQPYLKPLLFQIRGWFVNIMSRLSFQSVSNKQTLLSAPLVNKEFVKGIDDKTKVVPDIRSISAQSDINGRILLADMLLAKRGKRQMYTSSADKQISLQEAKGYSLNIVDKFEAELKQAAFRCGISVQQLKINFQEVQLSVLKKVIAGNYHEISGMLYSYAEKACPALEQKEKFSMSFKGKIEQMLQKEMMPLLDKANVDPSSVSTNKAVALSGPRTNLNNVSITTNSTELIR